MQADAAPVAISLCAFAHDPAAYADKDVTFRALVQKTPVSGIRLLDAGHPEDDSCKVIIEALNPGPGGETAKPDGARPAATLSATVKVNRLIDYGRVIVTYALKDVIVVRWGP